MDAEKSTDSERKLELLELAYGYVLERGMGDLSLRPLASAIGSSPRVLLYLFGSKDGLIRALLARARGDELALLDRIRVRDEQPTAGLRAVAEEIWGWLAEPDHRTLLTLWVEGYSRSLTDPTGPWAGFARETVDDWLAVLAAAQPADVRDTPRGWRQRTALLAVLRGALLDLLATGEGERVTAAVRDQFDAMCGDESEISLHSGNFSH